MSFCDFLPFSQFMVEKKNQEPLYIIIIIFKKIKPLVSTVLRLKTPPPPPHTHSMLEKQRFPSQASYIQIFSYFLQWDTKREVYFIYFIRIVPGDLFFRMKVNGERHTIKSNCKSLWIKASEKWQCKCKKYHKVVHTSCYILLKPYGKALLKKK